MSLFEFEELMQTIFYRETVFILNSVGAENEIKKSFGENF